MSNAQAAFTVGEIAEVGLADKLDGVLLSSDCGCRKPDPAFYEMLFDKFDLDKRDAEMKLMVGCTAEERDYIERFYNSWPDMGGMIVERE